MSKLKRYVIYSEDKSKISQSFIEKHPEFIPVFSFERLLMKKYQEHFLI